MPLFICLSVVFFLLVDKINTSILISNYICIFFILYGEFYVSSTDLLHFKIDAIAKKLSGLAFKLVYKYKLIAFISIRSEIYILIENSKVIFDTPCRYISFTTNDNIHMCTYYITRS